MTERLYGVLKCPRCGAAPRPGAPRCPGCARMIASAGGGLDLLDDSAREAADRFAAAYTALRGREGWIGANGREDPQGGEARLWGGRVTSVAEAARALTKDTVGKTRPIVLDVGSGGGWAARYLRDADVVTVDLLDAPAQPGVLHVRGDMQDLPVREASVDAALYAASLHHAPISTAIFEAARVLRPGGLIVAVDSPMYRGSRAQAKARARSAKYYASHGFPELAEHYHPIDTTSLRAALVDSGFAVERLDMGATGRRWWELFARGPSFLIARLNRRYA